jgi:hypothetical protein
MWVISKILVGGVYGETMGDQPGMVDIRVRGRCRVAIVAEVGLGEMSVD